MLVAHVEFSDGSAAEEMRGYQDSVFAERVVQFVWENERLTIPLHRIASVVETAEPD